MIRNKKDYKYYLEADRIASGVYRSKSFKSRIKHWLFPPVIYGFQKKLRKLEYYTNVKKGPVYKLYTLFLAVRFRKLSAKLGFSIPINVCGPGLNIAHIGTIVINKNSKIGENCRIHACVNIGSQAGFFDRAPEIGDNCYIGPGTKIYGKIKIANGTAMGANAVVNKSCEEQDCVLAGVPAKVIGKSNTLEMLIPGTVIIDKGYASKLDSGELFYHELREKFDLTS